MRFFRCKKKQIIFNSFHASATALGLNMLVVSDIGNLRTNNEDLAMVAIPASEKELLSKGILLLLADGMGGHNSGEVASSMALENFSKSYYATKGNMYKRLKKAVEKANSEIYKDSMNNEAHSGMGTTLTAFAINNTEIYLMQVGDSRAYILQNEELKQISKDDTVVQLLVDTGKITAEEAAVHPERNVLTNALGTKPDIEAQLKKTDDIKIDNITLLLCSDGLYDLLNDEEIKSILLSGDNLNTIAETLISTAKERGGYDNITVLLASDKKEVLPQSLKETQDYLVV